MLFPHFGRAINCANNFSSNISMALSSVSLGLYSVFQFASGKLISPQMTIDLFLGIFLRSNWKSSIVYPFELDMGGL